MMSRTGLVVVAAIVFTVCTQAAPLDGKLHDAFTDEEVKKCGGFISKGPSLVKGNGVLHIICGCGGSTHLDANGTIVGDSTVKNTVVIKSSQDGGQTWGKMMWVSPVNSKGEPETHYSGGTAIYHTASKTLVLQYLYVPSGDSTKTKDNKLFQIVSTDDAKSWSSPQDISHVMEPCRRGDGSLPHAGAGNRIETPAGRLVFGFGIPAMCLWYSDDGGQTWSNTGYKPHTEKINEFSLVVANTTTGELMANSRGNPYRQQYWSHDNGQSWNGPQATKLKDSVDKHNHGCEASMTHGEGAKNTLYFFNPSGQGLTLTLTLTMTQTLTLVLTLILT